MFALVWVLWFAGAWATPIPAQPPQRAPFAVVVDRASGHRPLLRLDGVLSDPALEEAARSGLPLRLRLRVELWRDGFFDSLEGGRSVTTVLVYEPLSDQFVVRTESGDSEPRRFRSFSDARAAVEGSYALDLSPTRRGTFYYTAVLELETLSLSDLQELERWLKGELQPAVSGDRSVPGAVGEGVKRLFIRVLRLPARRYEARSERFRID